jgi:hypothetical protein
LTIDRYRLPVAAHALKPPSNIVRIHLSTRRSHFGLTVDDRRRWWNKSGFRQQAEAR